MSETLSTPTRALCPNLFNDRWWVGSLSLSLGGGLVSGSLSSVVGGSGGDRPVGLYLTPLFLLTVCVRFVKTIPNQNGTKNSIFHTVPNTELLGHTHLYPLVPAKSIFRKF